MGERQERAEDICPHNGNRALIRAAILIALASPAVAEQTAIIGEPALYYGATTVRIQETEAPGAIAEIIYHNVEVNAPEDAGGYTVSFNGITVQIEYSVNVDLLGADSITVIPPAGIIAIPDSLTLQEGYDGTILLYADALS
jgi:hypothetical protein